MSQTTWTLAAVAHRFFHLLRQSSKAVTANDGANRGGARKLSKERFHRGRAGAAAAGGGWIGAIEHIVALFRPDSETVLFTGDSAKDKTALRTSPPRTANASAGERSKPARQVLYVGADNDPFPIPWVGLLRQVALRYLRRAKDEILARRIGRNEISAMEARPL